MSTEATTQADQPGSSAKPQLAASNSEKRGTSPAAERAKSIAVYVGIGLIIIYCLAPFYWMVVSSLRKSAEVFEQSPVPSPPSMQNYTAVFDPVNNFARALFNCILVAGVTTVAVLIIGVFAAYALARLEFRGKNLALSAIIATSMFPGIALVIPLFKIFTDIGWINTYQALILPSMSLRAAAVGVEPDRVLPADAAGARAGRDGGRVHAVAGVPQDHHPAGRTRRLHRRRSSSSWPRGTSSSSR